MIYFTHLIYIFIIISLVIYILHYFTKSNKFEQTQIFNVPHVNDKYQDINDFLYSIQEFYYVNPQAFEEMLDSINTIMQIKNKFDITIKNCTKYYIIAHNSKRNCINSLHSIIYNLSANRSITYKLSNSLKVLEQILNKYLYEMLDICKHNIKVDVNLTPIYLKQQPYNTFEDSIYELY